MNLMALQRVVELTGGRYYQDWRSPVYTVEIGYDDQYMRFDVKDSDCPYYELARQVLASKALGILLSTTVEGNDRCYLLDAVEWRLL